jgi:DNA-binding NarL/FixJ family response regulator
MALSSAGIEVCAEAEQTVDLLAAVRREHPDVCFLDVDLPESALHTAAEIASLAPRVAVVLLTNRVSETEFLDAVRVGVAGYLHKSISPAALPNVVHAVMNGEPAVPRSLVVALINGYRQRPPGRSLDIPNGRGAELTSREWEVLDFMQEGLSTREIANRLLISEVTVRRHISSVLKKLDVATRGDALNLLESA